MSSSGVSGIWSLRIGKQEIPGRRIIVDRECKPARLQKPEAKELKELGR